VLVSSGVSCAQARTFVAEQRRDAASNGVVRGVRGVVSYSTRTVNVTDPTPGGEFACVVWAGARVSRWACVGPGGALIAWRQASGRKGGGGRA
jgi:hypothetical protein